MLNMCRRSLRNKLHSSLLTLRVLTAALYEYCNAPVVELVDALDSKSCSERSAGSSPAWGTILFYQMQKYAAQRHAVLVNKQLLRLVLRS